jgi:hypothetical protein
MTKVQPENGGSNETTIREKAKRIVAEMFERSRRRRELGAPPNLGDVVHRAKLDADEARYERQTLNPLP